MRCDPVGGPIFSRNRCTQLCYLPWGSKMARIPMMPIGPVTTLNRSILRTDRGMSGTGGDDFICGLWICYTGQIPQLRLRGRGNGASHLCPVALVSRVPVIDDAMSRGNRAGQDL